MIDVVLTIRTVSESNARDHWSVKAKRVASQRTAATLTLRPLVRLKMRLPVVVTMTRISPGMLDDDNLRGALKAVRDGIADVFEVNDRDPRISWEYRQARGRGAQSVRIQIAPLPVVAVAPASSVPSGISDGRGCADVSVGRRHAKD